MSNAKSLIESVAAGKDAFDVVEKASGLDESYYYNKIEPTFSNRPSLRELWNHLGHAIANGVQWKILSHQEGMKLGELIQDYLKKLRR
jgi:hypothetical protein